MRRLSGCAVGVVARAGARWWWCWAGARWRDPVLRWLRRGVRLPRDSNWRRAGLQAATDCATAAVWGKVQFFALRRSMRADALLCGRRRVKNPQKAARRPAQQLQAPSSSRHPALGASVSREAQGGPGGLLGVWGSTGGYIMCQTATQLEQSDAARAQATQHGPRRRSCAGCWVGVLGVLGVLGQEFWKNARGFISDYFKRQLRSFIKVGLCSTFLW